MKRTISFASLILASIPSVVAAEITATPEEARAIATEAYIYGNPVVDNVDNLKRELRDTLVGRFAAEGLVRVDGKTVAAASYREFVEALYARGELPQPADLRGALAEMGESPG